ncbi:uncharacterized protein LOC122663062 [Telopea speciosissima]|uniref:uncharacterized protein LOC122663062 n=1 Tax=Telopea speciosissima TaxID=54955 RepID=UPI001CC779A9|nr:uncharacterized protein LOC122663062 [Telopea speciosissima]
MEALHGLHLPVTLPLDFTPLKIRISSCSVSGSTEYQIKLLFSTPMVVTQHQKIPLLSLQKLVNSCLQTLKANSYGRLKWSIPEMSFTLPCSTMATSCLEVRSLITYGRASANLQTSCYLDRHCKWVVVFNPICSVAVAPSAATRSFNTESQMRQYEDDERSIDVERQSDRSISRRRESFPSLFTDVFDPFVSPTRSLSQVLNLMDQMIENPFVARGMGSGTTRRGWDAKEDENALYVRIDMPGLGKEDVKVLVEENTLIIKGEGGKGSDEEKGGRKYSSRIDLPKKWVFPSYHDLVSWSPSMFMSN